MDWEATSTAGHMSSLGLDNISWTHELLICGFEWLQHGARYHFIQYITSAYSILPVLTAYCQYLLYIANTCCTLSVLTVYCQHSLHIANTSCTLLICCICYIAKTYCTYNTRITGKIALWVVQMSPEYIYILMNWKCTLCTWHLHFSTAFTMLAIGLNNTITWDTWGCVLGWMNNDLKF